MQGQAERPNSSNLQEWIVSEIPAIHQKDLDGRRRPETRQEIGRGWDETQGSFCLPQSKWTEFLTPQLAVQKDAVHLLCL
jgi:hypothetical protein